MALIYKRLRPNNRGTSVKHPIMAFKMSPDCYLKYPLNGFFLESLSDLSNLHSCWRLQVQTRLVS